MPVFMPWMYTYPLRMGKPTKKYEEEEEKFITCLFEFVDFLNAFFNVSTHPVAIDLSIEKIKNTPSGIRFPVLKSMHPKRVECVIKFKK